MSQAAFVEFEGSGAGGMVTGRFIGLSWLHARVGRRRPSQRSGTGEYRTYARIRVASSPAAMQPTVYLPSGAPAEG